MSLERARKVADAVLYEGYLLYPYRASALKNRYRWQFGVLAPPGWQAEAPFARTECLVRPDGDPELTVRLRFLQVVPRPSDGWEEGLERTLAIPPFRVSELPRTWALEVPGEPLRGTFAAEAEEVEGLVKLRLRTENTTPGRFADRTGAMRSAFVGFHLLAAVQDGRFLSVVDPPPEAERAAEGCRSEHTWPVLVDEGVLLSSPIVLPERPQVAPESEGDLFDATEIDELLTLRVRTLTDAEKAEALRTDERARRIVERSDAMPEERLARMHGAIRSLKRTVAVGERVRLRPRRRADVHDLFLEGRPARVVQVHQDLEGGTWIGVTLDDDPAADLHEWYGRCHFFAPEEVEPL